MASLICNHPTCVHISNYNGLGRNDTRACQRHGCLGTVSPRFKQYPCSVQNCPQINVFAQLRISEVQRCQRHGCNGQVTRGGRHMAHPGTRSGINANLIVGTPNFANNFQVHMMHGENTGGNGAHSGLHSLHRRDNQGRINNRAAVITLDVVNANQSKPFGATVTLGAGAQKHSTFFPTNMDFNAIQAAVVTAWQDYQRYQNVHIYQRMVAISGLAWVGYASLGGQAKSWVGSDRNGVGNAIYTAFPAINNRFT